MSDAKVASYTDAWIEISPIRTRLSGEQPSHPTRMRGLK